MNILVANDDGIQARGLQELVKALHMSPEVKVYVCAPDGQRSASGHGITVTVPVVLKEAFVEGAEKAYCCSGFPADCVKIGLKVFQSEGVEIDLVYSGINHGSNLGSDTLYSGTVSAAMEGAICGKPAIAISLCANEPKHFESCRQVARDMIPAALEMLKDKKGILNVNVPDLPVSEIKGVVPASLGRRDYAEHFYPVIREDGSMECSYSGEAVIYDQLGISVDVGAYQQDYITVSPVQFDLTDYRKLPLLEQYMKETGLHRK